MSAAASDTFNGPVAVDIVILCAMQTELNFTQTVFESYPDWIVHPFEERFIRHHSTSAPQSVRIGHIKNAKNHNFTVGLIAQDDKGLHYTTAMSERMLRIFKDMAYIFMPGVAAGTSTK